MTAALSQFLWRVQRFLFWDAVRPFDLFSGLNFLAWAHVLYVQPDLLARDSYASFQGLGAFTWASIMVLVGTCQLVSASFHFPQSANLRFLSMAVASGVWFMIAANFISSDVSTTAEANYLLLSVICMASGVWLGWTSHNS